MHVPSDRPLASWIRELYADDKIYVFYNSPEWKALRHEVLEDHGFECEECAGHVIDVLDTESQYLLADELWFGDNLAALGQFLKDLSECGLIQMFGDGVIKSPVVDEAALYFGRQRANGCAGGRPRKGGSENA